MWSRASPLARSMRPSFVQSCHGLLAPTPHLATTAPNRALSSRLSWAGSQALRKPLAHRAWLLERRIRRINGYRPESHETVALLPSFDGAGMDVARKFVQGESIVDDVNWKREEGLDALAQELVELHVELQEVLRTKQDTDRVEHLGEGVCVQRNKYALDVDALKGNPATISREESRSVVDHALDALEVDTSVCVTGQPGIGKTRGCMMYAIQKLLHGGAAVLYVGYKSDRMLLCLPREDGKYCVWSARSDKFKETRLALDFCVVAVIDPPESGEYSRRGLCRVLMFASNNAKKHFNNWEKDGVLLVTSMPSAKEVIVMTPELWDDTSTPHPWQVGTLNAMEQKVGEIEKRILLVGPIPRLVFNSDSFRDAIKECLTGASQATEGMSDTDLYKALRGKYSPFIAKHPASASSRILHLNSATRHHRTWRERKRFPITFQLTPIAAYVLRERLISRIEELRKESFEDFAFDWLCETTGRKPEIQRRRRSIEEEGYRRIVSLQADEMVLFRPVSKTFPSVDFALSVTKWFNAKSGPVGKPVYIRHGGALEFLTTMEEKMGEVYTDDSIGTILKQEPPVLTILTNESNDARLDKEMELSLFGVPVRVEVKSITKESVYELFSTDRTQELLEELEEYMGYPS